KYLSSPKLNFAIAQLNLSLSSSDPPAGAAVLGTRKRGADRELLRAGIVDRDSGIRLRAAERLLALGLHAAAIETLERLALETRTRNVSLDLLSKKGDPRRTAVVARRSCQMVMTLRECGPAITMTRNIA